MIHYKNRVNELKIVNQKIKFHNVYFAIFSLCSLQQHESISCSQGSDKKLPSFYQEGQSWRVYLNFPAHLRCFSVSELWLAHSSPYICFSIVFLTLSILFISSFLWLAIAFRGYRSEYLPKPHSVLPSSQALLWLTYLNFSSLGVLFQEHDS